MSASLKPLRPNLLALYAAAVGNAFTPASDDTLKM
jgi:hypothetical protein